MNNGLQFPNYKSPNNHFQSKSTSTPSPQQHLTSKIAKETLLNNTPSHTNPAPFNPVKNVIALTKIDNSTQELFDGYGISFNLGLRLLNMGYSEESLEKFTYSNQHLPGKVPSTIRSFMIGECYLFLEKSEKALTFYNQSVKELLAAKNHLSLNSSSMNKMINKFIIQIELRKHILKLNPNNAFQILNNPSYNFIPAEIILNELSQLPLPYFKSAPTL